MAGLDERIGNIRENIGERRDDRKQASRTIDRNKERVGNLRERLQDAREAGHTRQAGNLRERIGDRREVIGEARDDKAAANKAILAAQKRLAPLVAEQQRRENAREDAEQYVLNLRERNPWIDELGLSPRWLQRVVAGASSAAEIAGEIRQTPQYRKRFAGLFAADGRKRMSEAEYIRTEQSYRTLLRQYGFEGYDSPEQLIGFFDADMPASELQSRLEVFRGIQQGGQAIKDAFYVYAGMNVTDDDLLTSVLDPAAGQRLSSEFNQRVAQGAFDYQKWISRATAAGLGRVAQTLRSLQRQGAVTATAVQSIMGIRPEFAQRIMSAIYHGAGEDASTLSLAQALEAFEFAAIGSAAQASGLEMPTLERLRQIRAAGVERARAIEAYTAFGKNASQFNAAVQRARGMAFGQRQFERATFLGDAGLQREFEMSLAQEKAAGESQGAFRFAEDPAGRIVQRGFRTTV